MTGPPKAEPVQAFLRALFRVRWAARVSLHPLQPTPR